MVEFSEIWIVTFGAKWMPGEGWRPSFLAARELSSQRSVAVDRIALFAMAAAPYPTHERTLFVGFTAEAIIGCHIFLEWPLPSRIIDLKVEFRNVANGRSKPCGDNLAGALVWFGLPASGAITRGQTPRDGEREVALLEQLFLAMRGRLDFSRAILRGRYLIATGRIEAAGIPIDSAKFDSLKRHWPRIFGQFGPALGDAKLYALAIGEDGRHRAELRPFSSRTGRNQPSTAQFMLAAPGWFRQLIKPKSARGLVMADWAEQEFGIAAALSGDQRMMADYRSGDSYSAFADRYGADYVPSGRSDRRNTFKACALGVLNGIGSSGLARQIGCTLTDACLLLRQHRAEYPQFWRWSDAIEMHAYLHGRLQSVFGWGVAASPDSNLRFVRNFPMQSNGAEMLRLACCLATEKGVTVCAPSHDALLIEAPLADLADAVEVTEAAMVEASEIVLDGFPLRTHVTTIQHPDHYPHPQSDQLWIEIDRVLAELESNGEPAHERNATSSCANPRPISLYVYNRKDRSDARD